MGPSFSLINRFFPLGFRLGEFLTRFSKQCGGDGGGSWGDAFSHVVLCCCGYS